MLQIKTPPLEKEKLLKTKLLKLLISEKLTELLFETPEDGKVKINELLEKYFAFKVEVDIKQTTVPNSMNVSFVHELDKDTKVILDCNVRPQAKLAR